MTDNLTPVRCGCGGEAEIDWVLQPDGVYMTGVYCKNCGTKTIPFWSMEKNRAIDYAVTTWNKAMSGSAEEKVKAFWDGMSAEMKEERKKERWQRRKGSDCWECSECHAVLESDDIVRHNYYYCYHCGADMMNEDGYMKLEGTEHE